MTQLSLFFCLSFSKSPSFIEGRCPGSKAPVFNQSNFFATAPIINLNGRSFTMSCWIKQTEWVRDHFGAIYGDWHYPWQFLLSTRNQRIAFQRHSYGSDEWPFLESSTISLRTWTHVIIKWEHHTETATVYADGRKVGTKVYSPEETFYEPTGMPYMIGNDGHWLNHQFQGSVMDFYVFGKALSLGEINKLRGMIIVKLHRYIWVSL